MRSKLKTLPCLTSITVICALTACNTAPSVTVKTHYDHAATFGKYHTYTIDNASTGLGPTTAAALESSLRSSLAVVDSKNPGATPICTSFQPSSPDSN
jgi:hypothetical protein